MAEIFVHPDNPEDYLTVQYQQAFWRAMVEHAPGVLAYLRSHGVEAWLARYGLPREPWEQVGTDFLELGDPLAVELRNFWWRDTPPKTPRLLDYLEGLKGYDPSTTPAGRWKERVMERLEQYMADVERAYAAAGWKRERVKYEGEAHFVWLALRMEGRTCDEIADIEALKRAREEGQKGRRKKPITADAVARATRRLAKRLGIRLLPAPRCPSFHRGRRGTIEP